MLLTIFIVIAIVRGFDGRLPDETVPESYTLWMAPNIDNGTFAGSVDISIVVKTTTPVITLNSKDLVWRRAEIVDVATNRSVGVKSWKYARDREQALISVDGYVIANRQYVVKVWFNGTLRNDGTGFFKSVYTDVTKEKKWLVATHFQPTNARSAFPCYDEPAYKATFKIAIKKKRTEDEIALSNMPIAVTVYASELRSYEPLTYENSTWIYFKQTPPISTFSVAFFVGEFEHLDKRHKNMINVYSYLGHLYQIKHAMDISSDLLKVIENYTNVQSAMTKLDLLALPELGHEAVNNWGLNIYRESSLFVDNNTKTKKKMSMKMTMERIMAYQWFGNLVTPVWWDSVWLSEGFATYFEYFSTAKLEPKWRLDMFFLIEKQQIALEYDQTPKHPLSASVRTPNEINNIFDKISNDKGAAILMMLKNWVGEELFKTSINIYLTKNLYSVVKPEYLWNVFDNTIFELTNSSLYNYNIFSIMKSWTEQSGYPVVTVTRKYNTLVLTQERFSIKCSDQSDNSKWHVRLSYTTNNTKNFDTESTESVWLDPAINETTIFIDDNIEWYIFNIQSTGFYRVNYVEDNWLSLIKQLNDSPTSIHVANRARLIDDAFNLARAGQLSYTIPLRLTQYLEKEDDIIPWLSAMNSLNYILDRMRRSENGYADVKAFVGRLAGIAFRKLDNVDTEQRDSQYTNYVGWNAFSVWACKLDNDDCVKPALNYFRRWQNGEEISADIKDAAFCVGIKTGTTEDGSWDRMLDLYNTTKSYSEKESALNALACTENVKLLITYLELILKNKCPIKPNDYETFFNALSLTPTGISALTIFLQNNFETIVRTVKNGEKMVTTIYSILASKVSTEDEIEKMAQIALITTASVEFKMNLSSVYHDEIEENEKWFTENSITIRDFINPNWKTETNTTETHNTTTDDTYSKYTSNVSSKLHNYLVLLQIFAISISVKLFAEKIEYVF